ncbi:MAG: DUF502 domain-containing protein [Halodesulfurarchaeum sp.]
MEPTDSLKSATPAGPLEAIRESILTGIAIVIPGIITLYVIEFAIHFLLSGLVPWVHAVFVLWPGVTATALLVQGVTVSILVVGTLLIGFVVHFHAGQAAVDTVDTAVSRIPGVGTLYGSVRRMTDTMLVGDTHSFREVKLVEVPAEGHYMIGFPIAESPEQVEDSFAGTVETVFVPLAPNPVMAGFVIHVEQDRLRDVDMTVEEAFSAIVSLGAAEGSSSGSPAGGGRFGYEVP